MSRKLRTNIPVTREILKPQVPDPNYVREKDEGLKSRQESNYNRYHGVREMPPLNPGQIVWMPDREEEAQVMQEAGTRSYEVQTSEGTYRRNRRALVHLPDSPSRVQPIEENMTEPSVRRSGRESRPPNRLDPSWNT